VKNTRLKLRTSNLEQDCPLGATRCPLCNEPLTRVDPDDPLRDHSGIPPKVAESAWAGCLNCNLVSVAPFVEWHAFQGDPEQ
jgi:hypothetical protein